MGYGDEIMGSGMARGARARGRRVAFGDGRKILWSSWAPIIYQDNPNVAPPGSEDSPDLEWNSHVKGSRKYNKLVNGKWVWNYDFKPTPGEFFFTDYEVSLRERFPSGAVVVEPNVPWQKKVWPNKDWGEGKYETLVMLLRERGHRVIQFVHGNTRRRVDADEFIALDSLRNVASVMTQQLMYVGPEGGMHHTAAAVGIKAVVLFGGFIPPQVTGYDTHVNLTSGAEACGNIETCSHCREAMRRISVEEVFHHCLSQLEPH